MANGYMRAGAALGDALFGNGRAAYNDQLGTEYKLAYALEQARQARNARVLGDQNVASRQGLTADLIGRARAGDVDALNQLTAYGLTSNDKVDLGMLGQTQEFAMRQAARDKAVLGDPLNPNSELFGIANGPVETTKISDGVAYSPLGSSSQSLNVTPLGEAAIGQRNASAASSYASANNSNASAARTRQAAGIDAAEFGLKRSGQWNPGGKAAGGTLGDSSKPLPVGALKELLGIEDALGGTQVLGSIIAKNRERLDNGTLQIGPLQSLIGSVRTGLGVAGDSDVALNEWNSDLTKIVNESLRLNKGVQTEGDAQRAANELMNARDAKTVRAALGRLETFNNQAIQLQRQKQSLINSNYGRTSTLGDPPSALPSGPGLPAAGAAGAQRARNPRTGQVLVLINGQWVPE